MNRAERRRAEKEAQKKKTVTYNLTKAQLDQMIEEAMGERLEEIKKQSTQDGIKTALVFLLTLPRTVLKNHFWQKSYKKRLPKFTELVMEYYSKWQAGELDMEQLVAELEAEDGVKLINEEDSFV